MDENQRADGYASNEDIFSKSVRAGKRTYYFDVKTTRKNDFYLTITERKKRVDENGQFRVEKHKIFLYQEDFTKFSDILSQAMEYIDETIADRDDIEEEKKDDSSSFTDISFDDLDKN